MLKRPFVFHSQVGRVRLSLLKAFEKVLILHEKKIPKGTSVTSHVTLTDTVQSRG